MFHQILRVSRSHVFTAGIAQKSVLPVPLKPTGLVAMAPGNYERYIQALKNAEARGEFRWHVDPNDMNYDDPLYKQQLRKKDTN